MLLFFPLFFLISCDKENEVPADQQYLALIQGKLQSMNMPRPEGSYNYPIYLGMKGWDALKTTADKVNACQIPPEILDSMSTQAVIQAIWEHPLLVDIVKEGNYQSGFDAVIAKTNAYKVLLTRRDSGRCLWERYVSVRSVDGEEFLPDALEVLFSQPDILYRLCYPERIELAKLLLEKKDPTKISTLFLLGRIMKDVYFLPLMDAIHMDEKIGTFLTTSSVGMASRELIKVITSNAELFIISKNELFEDMIKDKLDCMNMSRPEGSFNYYIYPGMPEWSVFKATWQMSSTSQIPVELLKRMSTQAVIQSIWEYPFFEEIAFRADHYDSDFNIVLSSGNSYLELKSRVDAVRCLLERYRLVHSIAKAIWFPKAFEILISRNELLSQLSYQEKMEMVKLAFDKDQIRQDNPAYAKSLTREISWYLIGRAMQSAEYTPFMKELAEKENLRLFLSTSYISRFESDRVQSERMLNSIISFGKQFINE